MYVNRETMAEIAGLIGDEAIDTLLSLKGGTRICVPAKIRDDHWLAEAIGFDEACALSRMFTSGRGSIDLELPARPKPSSYSRVVDLTKRDWSVDQIAAELGLTRRNVQRHIRTFKRKRRERLAALTIPKTKGK